MTNLYHNMMKTCCTDSTWWDKGRKKKNCIKDIFITIEELDGLAIRALGVRSRKLSQVYKGRSSGGKLCRARESESTLVLAVFADVNAHQSALGSRGF
jgi:hypothetical protein